MRYVVLALALALSLTSCRRSGCTDARALNYDDKAKKNDGSCFYPDPTKAIGKAYQGGIIVYHFKQAELGYVPGETHGLIMVPMALGTAQWGCSGTLLQGANGQQVGSGAQNTQEIISLCTNSNTAAHMVDTCTYGGYNDWFLPSYDEVKGIYDNRVQLSFLPQSAVWSSTQNNASYAYHYDLSDGSKGAWFKNLPEKVIAVRKF